MARNLAGVATQVKTFIDPVTQQQVSISAAGIALALEVCYCDWWAEDEEIRNAPPPVEEPPSVDLLAENA